MSESQLQHGLEKLRLLAAEFRIGPMDHERMGFPLLDGKQVRAWVSEEILSDLPATPELEPVLREGVEATRREIRGDTGRVVLITTTGPKYES